MKLSPFTISAIVLSFAGIVVAQSESSFGPQDKPEGFTNLEIGDSAPDFSLHGIDGKTYTLSDFSEPDVLMIYFTGTHCPTSHGVEQRLQAFIKEMEDKSFACVAINPNHSSGLRPDEFGHTDYDETFEDSKRYANDLGWTFPFLYDGDEQVTARAYGCLATPHVFIFDKDRQLRYNGRFDDSRFPDPATVKSPDARNAVEELTNVRREIFILVSQRNFLEAARAVPNPSFQMRQAMIEADNGDPNILEAALT
ncbi:MAG: redoxin domain-containing protein, partial [Verrucomicrobiota bacterium]